MGLGVSILLIAAGAILTVGGHRAVSGVELQTVGWILLIVGIVGLRPLARVLVVVGGRPRRPAPPRRGAASVDAARFDRGWAAPPPARLAVHSARRQLDRERRADAFPDSTSMRPSIRRTSSREM